MAVRKARQSLQDNPRDARSWLLLADAYRLLWTEQEDYWARDAGLTGPSRRSQMRQTQVINALKVAADLDPQNADTQYKLARSYYQLHYLDAAIAPMFRAAQFAAADTQERDVERRKLQAEAEGLQAEVQKRQDDFDLRVASYKGIGKYQLALQEPYRRPGAPGKENVDERGMGLAYSAMKAMHDVAEASTDQKEKYLATVVQMRLALMLGQARELAAAFAKPELRASYPDIYADLAASLGDYEGVEKSFAALENAIDMKVPAQNLAWNVSQWLMMTGTEQLPFAPRLAEAYQITSNFSRYLDDHQGRLRQSAELHLLRGLSALEMGDTAKAKALLQESLNKVGPEQEFPERIIAERYLKYLSE